MKGLRKTAVTALATVAVCAGILTAIGILLLPAELASPEQSVHENIYGVGYNDFPESKGLFFECEDGSGAFIYLDFEKVSTLVYLFDSDAAEKAAALPFITDYSFSVTEQFVGELCDRLGGIEIQLSDGSSERYNSAALGGLFKSGLSSEKRLQICISFFEKIAKKGLSSEDFMFIIEETDATLSYSVCYDWLPHIKEMLCNCVFG